MAQQLTAITKQISSAGRYGCKPFSSALALMLVVTSLFVPDSARGWTNPACSCGFSDGQFTKDIALPFSRLDTDDGSGGPAAGNDWNAWQAILNDPDNVSCDGGRLGNNEPYTYFQPQPDRDLPSIGTTGRDLLLFAYTWDTNYVYALTGRVASATAQQSFVYYADKNNNGRMETGEPVIVAQWAGASVDISVGTYSTTTPGGDPFVDASGYGDGYRLPGKLKNVNEIVHQNTSWAGWNGLYMEWRISWADLGMTYDTPFTFHVSSSNCNPASGGFPGCVEDNMGGCGGGSVSTQYADLTFVPDRTVQADPGATVYAAHTVTNTGNGTDSFEFTSAVSGGFTPTIAYYRDVNGNGAYDAGTDTLLTTDGNGLPYTGDLTAGSSINILIAYTLPGGTSGNASVVTTAKSNYQPLISQAVTDTINVTPYFTMLNKALGGLGRIAAADQFTVQIKNGAAVVNSTAASTTSGSGATVTAGTGVTGQTLLSAGVAYTLTEVMAAGSSSLLSHYGTSISCTNGFAGSATTLPAGDGQSFTITPAYGDNISCTLTNTPPRITLVKSLGGVGRIAAADQFTVQIKDGVTVVNGTADSTTAGSGAAVTGGTGTTGATAVAAGVSYTLTEVMAGGSSSPLAQYDTTISCSNGFGGSVTTLPSGSGQSFSLTPAAKDDITCTLTNTPKPAIVTLRKDIASRVSANDQFVLTVSDGITPSTATTSGSSTGLQGVSAGKTVTFGTPLTLSEAMAIGSTGTLSQYGQTIACTNTFVGSSTVLPSGSVAGFPINITPAAGDDITCTITNTYLMPLISILKSANVGNANPGQIITYTVQIANTGTGVGTSVVLRDDLSPYAAFGLDTYGAGVRFSFTDSFPASGLSLGAPEYSNDNGSSWSYPPVSGGGGAPAGYDGNITNWRIPMTGTIRPDGSFTLKYQLIVK